MNDRWTKIVVVGLLVLVVGVPFVMRPRDDVRAAHRGDGPVERLVIITPHNEQIRYEVERAFNAWRVSQNLPGVEFDWRSSGGTSDLRNQVLHELEKVAQQGREEQGLGYDLFFGGGDYEHTLLANGKTVTRGGREVRVSASVPVELPPGLLEEAYPSPVIGGEPLYHPELRWVGVVLSSFGIVYNRDVLSMLQLPEPTTWADMQDHRYRGWVALADPGHSGSIAATYNAILRREGWNEGWQMLRRIFANARYFTASAAKVPVDVSAGEAAAGMCIDFYGRFQSGAIGGNRVGYIDPARNTAINADPISIMIGAPNRPLANEFVVWLLSRPAQQLWNRRLGEENGPLANELRRMPIRRDLYNEQEQAHWADRVNPYDLASPFPKAMPSFHSQVATVAEAMAIHIHDDLVRAWDAIQRLDDADPRKAKCIELFDAMPDDLTVSWPDDTLAMQWKSIIDQPDHPRYDEVAATLADFRKKLSAMLSNADGKLAKRLEWTAFFRANYREIVKLAK
jgi:iron(III) transport system substrate-binding protein